jgi:hypothetical protein
VDDEVNVTGKPDVLLAVSVGVVPKFCVPGLLKVMVWPPLGVTAFDAADGAPGPTTLVAVTVKVYAVPLVNPVTAIGLLAPEPVSPPGLEVTV